MCGGLRCLMSEKFAEMCHFLVVYTGCFISKGLQMGGPKSIVHTTLPIVL